MRNRAPAQECLERDAFGGHDGGSRSVHLRGPDPPSGVIRDWTNYLVGDDQHKTIAQPKGLGLILCDRRDITMAYQLGSHVLLLLDIGCLSFHR